jgi:RNA recognition motif-containing protein
MVKNIYVGNLPWSVTEEDVRKAFSAFGEVQQVKFVEDRETGRFRGFGFVEMDAQGAGAAIEALDGTDLGGRAIKVNEAKPRVERKPRW